jgi:hypothetical protein
MSATSDHLPYARLRLIQMKQSINKIEIAMLSNMPTENQLDVLNACAKKLDSDAAWFTGESPISPQARVELPAETFVRQREDRRLWNTKALKKPDTARMNGRAYPIS